MRLMILENNSLISTVTAAHGPVSIGSSPDCKVHLPDPRIGAHQVNLVRDDSGAWWLEVRDEQAPIYLNRAAQHGRSRISHFDEISLGPFSIRLYLENEQNKEEARRQRLLELTRAHSDGLPLGTIISRHDVAVTLSKEQLEQIAILAMRLERCTHVREAFTPLLRALLRLFTARRAWIGLRRPDHPDFDVSFGLSHKEGACAQPVLAARMRERCMTHGHYVCTPKAMMEGVGSAMAAPLVSPSGNIGMIYVENDPDDPAFEQGSLDILSAAACCVAMPIDDVMRRGSAARQEIAASERAVAREIQEALTPSATPKWAELEVAAFRRPGTGRCCDLYDFVQLPDRRAALVVARLTAEGAALPRFFAEVRAAFRVAALHSDAPHLFARGLNWLIYSGDLRRTLDLAVLHVNPAVGRVDVCIAGRGVVAAVLRPDGSCRPLKVDDAPAIGAARATPYVSAALDLRAGDAIAVATAGADASMNSAGEPFGVGRLLESLCDALGDTPSHTLGEFAIELDDFVRDGRCPEDVTVLIARRNPPEPADPAAGI